MRGAAVTHRDIHMHTHIHTHNLPLKPLNPPIRYLSGGGRGGAKDPDWMSETATSESFFTEKADPPSLAGAHTTTTNAQFSLDLANFTYQRAKMDHSIDLFKRH